MTRSWEGQVGDEIQDLFFVLIKPEYHARRKQTSEEGRGLYSAAAEEEKHARVIEQGGGKTFS